MARYMPKTAAWLLAWCLVAHEVHGQLTYPITWTSIPSSSSPKNLTANCICDLTALVCDEGCCCDPACPDDVVAATQAAGRCLPSGPRNETLDYCMSESSIVKVNLPASSDYYDVVVNSADDKFVKQLLCVVSSRNPTIGDYYPDPAAGASNNQGFITCPKQPSTAKLNSYVQQTPVYVSVYGSKVPLTVPYPAFSMDCNDNYAVGFLSNLPTSQKDIHTTCTRRVFDQDTSTTMLPDLCTVNGSLSITKFTQLAFFASPNDDPAAIVPVTVAQVLFEDPVSGAQIPISPNVTTYYSGSTCNNALRSISLMVYYSWHTSDSGSTGSIDKIEVSAVVTSLDDTTLAMKQSVRVMFTSSDAADIPHGLQVMSGNPGYQPGFQVLAGQLVSSASNDTTIQPPVNAIQRLVQGMPLPAPSLDGTCSPTSQTPVRFGQNTTISCTVPFNAAELKTLCSDYAGKPDALLAMLLGDVYQALGTTAPSLQLGIWGNSNFTYAEEWVPVDVSSVPPFNSLIHSDADNSCSNLMVGFDLQILTGVAFSANNLQSKILHAVLCWRTATWTFPANMAPDYQQPFHMTSTVTFISKEQSLQTGTSRPVPPLVVPLPEDIFFPFVTNGAGLQTGLVFALQAIAVAVTTCLALLSMMI